MLRLIVIIFLLVRQMAFAQIDSVQSYRLIKLNDTSKSIITIRDPATVNFKKQNPLIIVNNKKFSKTLISHLVLDVSNINTVKFFSPTNDSARLFGSKSKKHGVMILSTKKPIVWVNTKQITKQYGQGASRKNILFLIDGVGLDGMENVFFEKNIIQSIEVQDSVTTFKMKKYFKTIKVKTKASI